MSITQQSKGKENPNEIEMGTVREGIGMDVSLESLKYELVQALASSRTWVLAEAAEDRVTGRSLSIVSLIPDA